MKVADKRTGHKPKPNHPWGMKYQVSNEVRRWAMEQAEQTKITNFKTGGGKPQK